MKATWMQSLDARYNEYTREWCFSEKALEMVNATEFVRYARETHRRLTEQKTRQHKHNWLLGRAR